MELVAKLRNGHSGFRDNWLMDNYGQMLGFYAHPMGGSWVVTRSSIADLKPGDVITRVNQQSCEDFFMSVRKYLTASNEREARWSLFNRPYLFPDSFFLELADGRKVPIVRKSWPVEEQYHLTYAQNAALSEVVC